MSRRLVRSEESDAHTHGGSDNGRALKLTIVEGSEEMGRAAASVLGDTLHGFESPILALPTGRTPVSFYEALVESYRRGALSFRASTTFNLDEFVGLPWSHPGTYFSYMRRHLFDHVDIPPERAHLPNGSAVHLGRECDRYESAIYQSGGIHLAVLGIGENGHIGFNEPGSAIDSRTRVVDLTPSSIAANAHLFGQLTDVPAKAITMGIGTILDARRIVLLATGSTKADALFRALRGPVTPDLPASALQLHTDVTVIADREAAELLT